MYALSQSVQKITNQMECALDSRILLMLQLHSSLTAVHNLHQDCPHSPVVVKSFTVVMKTFKPC